MIRIVGIQRNEDPAKEFILLQNQGSLRINLRGHVVIGDAAVNAGDPSEALHIFTDDVDVHPGMYVLLRSGGGVSHWNHSQDRYSTFYSYMQRRSGVWYRHLGAVHVLAPQHSWQERPREAMIV